MTACSTEIHLTYISFAKDGSRMGDLKTVPKTGQRRGQNISVTTTKWRVVVVFSFAMIEVVARLRRRSVQ